MKDSITATVVVYASAGMKGVSIEINGTLPPLHLYANVVERDGRFSALFPEVPCRNVSVLYKGRHETITVFPNITNEVDWQTD